MPGKGRWHIADTVTGQANPQAQIHIFKPNGGKVLIQGPYVFQHVPADHQESSGGLVDVPRALGIPVQPPIAAVDGVRGPKAVQQQDFTSQGRWRWEGAHIEPDLRTPGGIHELAADGTISAAGVAMTSVAPINLKATDAEALLVGNAPSAELFAEAGEAAAAAADPKDDERGSARWKRQVVATFTRRALAAAAEQAQA